VPIWISLGRLSGWSSISFDAPCGGCTLCREGLQKVTFLWVTVAIDWWHASILIRD
jgi:hypothetical protein